MRVLITGIGGLLGGRLAHWIVDNHPDVDVVGVDDFSCGYAQNVPDGLNVHPFSLGAGRTIDLAVLFRNGFDAVFHFAAYAAEGLSPFIRTYNYRNNLLATAEVVNGCLKYDVGRLVYTSSMAVYGRQKLPFDETAPTAPIDPYGIAKAAAERDIQTAGAQHGLEWSIIRPHNVYGIGQDIWTPYRNVLGIWMRRALEGQPLRVFGSGGQSRAFTWIDDILGCLWSAATEPGACCEVINLGGTHPVHIKDAAHALIDVMGRGEIEYCQPRHEVKHAWCTHQKSADRLGYEHKTDLTEGLGIMWQWAQDVWDQYPARRRPPAIPIEVDRGLYSYWKPA